MLIRLQGNVNDTFQNPLWQDQNDIIYCNEGGKQNMSLAAKNIPPMVSGTLPSEIWIRNTGDTELYSKVRSYNSNDMILTSSPDDQPLFRFQLIYDGYDFLYYPEFKLYERPYLVLERNYSTGNDTLMFSGQESEVHDNADNINFMDAGDIVTFLDTNDSYTITERSVIGTDVILIFDVPLDQDHHTNDVLVVKTKKYEDKANSNILVENTTTSIFKFKFVDVNSLGNKTWAVGIATQMDDDYYTLLNNNTTAITDLQGDDKLVSISNDVEIVASTIIINNDIDTSDDEIEFSQDITNELHLNSYITLKSTTDIEIMKVVEILSSISVRVLRAQLETDVADFTSAGSELYLPKYFYFWMLPVNNFIDFRYVVYRNIDFVLTWV